MIKFIFITLLAYQLSLPTQPTNLLRLSKLDEIQLDAGLSACKSVVDGEQYLKILAGSIQRKDPSVLLPSIKVKPGVIYSFLVSAVPHTKKGIAHQVMQSGVNLVWPGASIINGISMTQFMVPDSAQEVTLGFAFLDVSAKEYVLVKDFALFEGEILLEDWDGSMGSGFKTALNLAEEQPNNFWIRLFAMIAVGAAIVVVIYLSSLRSKA